MAALGALAEGTVAGDRRALRLRMPGAGARADAEVAVHFIESHRKP